MRRLFSRSCHPRHHSMGRHHHGGRHGFGRFGSGFMDDGDSGGRAFGMGRKLSSGDLQLLVLALLAEGAPNPRIAGQLVVSLDTVKKHVSHLLGKLGAANRTEAVTRARQLGLIP